MKVKVMEDACIGCGACTAIAPEVFDFNDDGLATAKNSVVAPEFEDSARDAIEGCPVNAIIEE